MQTIVGVLRGGPSKEHDVSLLSGAAILANLPTDKFIARDIYIDRAGVWHDKGRPTTPERVLSQIDLALIGLHGEYGEDGQLQRILERFGVPYAGADSFGSARAMHKLLAKHRADEVGIVSARYRHIEKGSDHDALVREAVRAFTQPVVVKPIGWGSSVGVSIVGGYAPVRAAVDELFRSGAHSVLIEEFLRGREATVGVVEGLRDESLYALPVIEIIPPETDFFSYDAKYSGTTQEICPGNFTKAETRALQEAAKRMHSALELRHYSRSDFILTPRGVFYLETNTLPGLTEESLMPKSLAAVGISFPAFLTHLADLALKR
jgi:D-alanine-D-alanine ligase